MLEWIEFAINIGPSISEYCSIPKMNQLHYTHPRQFDKLRWDGKNHAFSGHRKIAVWALWDFYYQVDQIGDA
ncbi:MAG: hypothetical protein WAW52_13245 [Methanothrix sp.]